MGFVRSAYILALLQLKEGQCRTGISPKIQLVTSVNCSFACLPIKRERAEITDWGPKGNSVRLQYLNVLGDGTNDIRFSPFGRLEATKTSPTIMASPDCWLPPVRASFRAYSYFWMLRWRWRYSIGKAKARCMWPRKVGPANPPSEKSEVLGKGSACLEKKRHVGWLNGWMPDPQEDTLTLCDCWYMPMEMWKEKTMPVWLRRTMRSFMVTHRLYACCANCGDGQSASGVKERWTKNLTAKGRGWLDDCDGWSSFKDVLIFFIPYLADLTSRRVTHIWWWKLELQRRADLYTSHKARPWNLSRVLRRCLKKVRLGDAVLGVLCFVVVVVVVAAGVVVVVVVVVVNVGKFQVMSSGWVFEGMR